MTVMSFYAKILYEYFMCSVSRIGSVYVLSYRQKSSVYVLCITLPHNWKQKIVLHKNSDK